MKVHLHHFSKIESQKESQNSRNQGFSYYFCMMIEGSGSRSRAGSGSIPLTSGSGSGSGRPKNMWIRWTRIRIRIRNTAFFYSTSTLIGFLDSLTMWPTLAGNSQNCGASLSLAGIVSHFLAGNSKSGAQDCNWLLSCQGLYVQSVIEALRKSNETRAWTKVSISDFFSTEQYRNKKNPPHKHFWLTVLWIRVRMRIRWIRYL